MKINKVIPETVIAVAVPAIVLDEVAIPETEEQDAYTSAEAMHRPASRLVVGGNYELMLDQ